MASNHGDKSALQKPPKMWFFSADSTVALDRVCYGRSQLLHTSHPFHIPFFTCTLPMGETKIGALHSNSTSPCKHCVWHSLVRLGRDFISWHRDSSLKSLHSGGTATSPGWGQVPWLSLGTTNHLGSVNKTTMHYFILNSCKNWEKWKSN